MLLLKSAISVISKADGMEADGMSYYQVQSWSHVSWVTHDETGKNFYQSVTKTPTRRRKKTGNCKASCITRERN